MKYDYNIFIRCSKLCILWPVVITRADYTRDVSRSRGTSRDTFLSVSVSSRSRYANASSRSRTLKASEHGPVSIET